MGQSQETCPSCRHSRIVCIGTLPDTHWFSGKRLANPERGGCLYRCANCSLKFRYPVRSAAEYAELYDNATTATWPTNSDRPDWDRIIRYVSEHGGKGARVLDFGCYAGGLLARLGHDRRLYGVEINRAAAAVASKYAHVRSCIDELPPNLRFEIVIAADVIEHTVDPGALIDRLAGLLTENGVLIVTTGDADFALWNRYGVNWWYCFFSEHVAFISRKWLSWFASSKNMQVLCCQSFHYIDYGFARRQFARLAVHLYGRLGNVFLLALRTLKTIIGRMEIRAVPGAGAMPDHLFIVLSRRP